VRAYVFGGLGNQLFQFAAARQLASGNEARLELDLSRFNSHDPFKRSFLLDKFKLCPHQVVGLESCAPVPTRVRRILRGASQALPLRRRRLIVERSPSRYLPLDSLRLSHSVTIDGYWQNERYFGAAASSIRREYELAVPVSTEGNKWLRRVLEAVHPVAVHVRRLHGVTSHEGATPDPTAEAKGLALTEQYYRNAVDRIRGEVGTNAELFVFSDFEQWAREALSFAPLVHFVTGESRPDYEDLWLMTHCRHHVIANSSFSWWGAWLAEPNAGVTIAPAAAQLLPTIPARWLRVSSK